MKVVVLAAACIVALIIALPTLAVDYAVVNIGFLELYTDGCTGQQVGFSRVTGINNAGQVVGISSDYVGQEQSFIWSESGGISAMDGCTDGYRYKVRKITNSGKALFGTGDPYGEHTGYYDSTTGTFTAMDYAPIGINSNNEIGANRLGSYSYPFPMFKNQSGNWLDLDPLPGFPEGTSTAVDMNESGQVCGTAYDGYTNRRTTFLWSGPGQMVDIGAPAGYQTSSAIAMNDAGWVLGRAGRNINNWWYRDVFMWHSAYGFTLLPDSGYAGMVPVDINNRNQVVGFYESNNPDVFRRSWIWEVGNGITDLENIKASGINDNGWIAGTAVADYRDYGVVFQPAPEPSSIMSLAGCLGALGGLLLKRRR